MVTRNISASDSLEVQAGRTSNAEVSSERGKGSVAPVSSTVAVLAAETAAAGVGVGVDEARMGGSVATDVPCGDLVSGVVTIAGTLDGAATAAETGVERPTSSRTNAAPITTTTRQTNLPAGTRTGPFDSSTAGWSSTARIDVAAGAASLKVTHKNSVGIRSRTIGQLAAKLTTSTTGCLAVTRLAARPGAAAATRPAGGGAVWRGLVWGADC